MNIRVAWSNVFIAAVLALILSGCAPALGVMEALMGVSTSTNYDTSSYNSYTLEVENYCGGADEFVDVYVDGVYYGMVYDHYTFYGVSYGSHSLLAEGTGHDGSSFVESYFADGNYVWTLC